MHRVKNGRLQIIRPKCKCGHDMSFWVRRAVGGVDGSSPAAVMSNLTMGPQVVWVRIIFRCERHHDQTAEVSGDDLIAMAGYPENKVDFITNAA